MVFFPVFMAMFVKKDEENKIYFTHLVALPVKKHL
jgi:hypothetical protein